MLVNFSGLAVQDMGPRSMAPRVSLVEDLKCQTGADILSRGQLDKSPSKLTNSWTASEYYHD
jgi:hypothetical protein